jgi:hypothetical protein
MTYRITTTHGKTVYISFGSIAVALVSLLGAAAGGSAVGIPVTIGALGAWIVLGARMFRCADEPVQPPRAWWRFTSRPTGGFVLAVLFALQAAITGLSTYLASLAGTPSGPTSAAAALSAAAAIVYLHSSLRLRATP